MLEQLKIQNYQILREVELKLSKFVVIVGSSGSGKSSIVRALKNLFTASAGTGAVRHGTPAYKIGLQFDGDKAVAWAKGKKTNVYITGPNAEDRYDKVGLDVPEKAAKLFNLGVVYFGDKRTVVNIQDQHDAPFLISESGSVVSEFLGSVSGLDKLFLVVDEIAQDTRKTKMSINGSQEQLVLLEEQINKLSPLEAFKLEVDNCVTRFEQVESECKIITEKQAKLAELQRIEQALAVAEQVESAITAKLDVAFRDLVDLQLKFNQIEANLVVLSKIEATLTEISQIEALERAKQGLLQQILIDAERNLPKTGNCPTCGQEVSEVCIQKIMQGLRDRYANS